VAVYYIRGALRARAIWQHTTAFMMDTAWSAFGQHDSIMYSASRGEDSQASQRRIMSDVCALGRLLRRLLREASKSAGDSPTISTRPFRAVDVIASPSRPCRPSRSASLSTTPAGHVPLRHLHHQRQSRRASRNLDPRPARAAAAYRSACSFWHRRSKKERLLRAARMLRAGTEWHRKATMTVTTDHRLEVTFSF